MLKLTISPKRCAGNWLIGMVRLISIEEAWLFEQPSIRIIRRLPTALCETGWWPMTAVMAGAVLLLILICHLIGWAHYPR